MDFGFFKRARGIKHKAAKPFYAWKPAQVSPAAAAAAPPAQPTAAASGSNAWSVPAPPPSSTMVAMEAGGGNGVALGGDADVDRRAALYISRVQERLRRERMADDWKKYY